MNKNIKKIIVIISLICIVFFPYKVDATNTGAVSFNGSTQGLYTTSNFTALGGLSSMSVSVWVKTSVDNSDCMIVGINDSSAITFQIFKSGNNYYFITRTNGTDKWSVAIPEASVETGTWKNIAAVYSGSAITVYIDGTQYGSSSSATGNIESGYQTRLSVGYRYSSSDRKFNGYIDDVRVYGGVVYPTGINAELVGNETYLKGYWKLNNSLVDSTSYANNLNTYGSTTYISDVPFDAPITTCTYSGTGDWNVLESDNCYITSNTYVNGQFNLIGSTTGAFGCASGVNVSATRFNFGTNKTTFDIDCFAHH